MVSINVLHLYRHGPATPGELPAEVGDADEVEGILTFRPAAGDREPTPVHYLMEHDREAVVRRFLEANASLVEAHSRPELRTVIGAHVRDRAWEEATGRVLEEFYVEETAEE